MLGMDGPLWECNVITYNCTQLFDLVKELNIPASFGEQPHFKAAHTMNGRLVVASNTFEEADFTGLVGKIYRFFLYNVSLYHVFIFVKLSL